MAAASNPAVSIQSPRGSADGVSVAAVNSPRSRRSGSGKGVSSPWTQIVRGGEPESPVPAPASPSSVQEQTAANCSPDWPDDPVAEAAQAESSDYSGGGTGTGTGNAAAKKPVWNKPSNGVLEVSPVMDAVSWPALSESTNKASPKSTSSDSLKALPDMSLPALQGTGNSSSSPHKQAVANNANANSTPNHGTPTRQKSMKRGGGNASGNVSANGGSPQPPPHQDLVAEMPPSTPGKPGSAAMESSPRDHTHRESQRGGFGSQSHSGNDHQHQRNSFRRGNGGQHPRGDGSYHHSYGGKRDQDRGNQEWNPHSRSFNSRDTHMQPRGFPRGGYMRPSPQFIPPAVSVPVRPFGNLVYPDVASPVIYVQGPPPPDSLRGMPIVAPLPPHAMFFPVPDPQLYAKIVSQIEYYFSNDNLIKDTFLRQNMDDQGWVPIKLIAGFKKVMYLTDNIQLILEAMRNSTVVEVQGDKVRKRNDWMRWIMPPPVHRSNVSSPQGQGISNHDLLASHLQSVTLDERAANQGHAELFFNRSSSGEFNSQPQQSGGEGSGQVINQVGVERSAVA